MKFKNIWINRKTMTTFSELNQLMTTFFNEQNSLKKNAVHSNVSTAYNSSEFQSRLSEVLATIASSLSSADKPTKGRRTKATKDPNAPKRAVSAYICFSNDKREEAKRSNPEASSKELMGILGKMWRETSDADKQQYNDQHDQDVERYQRELSTYVAPAVVDGGEQPSRASRVRKAKDPNAPKQLTGYMIFCRDNRPRIKESEPDIKAKDVMVRLGAEWRELSDAEKNVYNAQSSVSKAVGVAVEVAPPVVPVVASKKSSKTAVAPVVPVVVAPVVEEAPKKKGRSKKTKVVEEDE